MSERKGLLVGAVVLAAGASTRLGRPKQLVQLEGSTLLERSVAAAVQGGCAPVVVVVPPALAVPLLPGVQLVVNGARGEGVASSVRMAIEVLAKTPVDAAVLLVCDQPFVGPEQVRALRREAERCTEQIVASGYAGVQGVPALFKHAVFPKLLSLRGDRGAGQLFAHVPTETVNFPAGSWDIDTPSDLKQLQSLAGTETPI